MMDLREKLAVRRTALANERTFLAYIRTALTFFVAGISLIKFFEARVIQIAGFVFIPVAVWVLFLGIRRYRMTQKELNI